VGERIMSTLSDIGLRLALIIIMVNVMLFVGGYIAASQVPAISSFLRGVDIADFKSDEFQKSMVLKNPDTNASLVNTSGLFDQFITGVLDFISDIPVVGHIVTLFRMLYELLVMGSFGAVLVLITMKMPGQIVVPVGVSFFLIYAIALYEHILDFVRSRGGSK
jgi:hypothetical protein